MQEEENRKNEIIENFDNHLKSIKGQINEEEEKL